MGEGEVLLLESYRVAIAHHDLRRRERESRVLGLLWATRDRTRSVMGQAGSGEMTALKRVEGKE